MALNLVVEPVPIDVDSEICEHAPKLIVGEFGIEFLAERLGFGFGGSHHDEEAGRHLHIIW